MRVAICSSMVFAEKMLNVKSELEKKGVEVLVSEFINSYVGKNVQEKELLTNYHKREKDAIFEFYKKISISDAILVLNYDRRGIPNYIGGNTFLEMGFAHVLNKRIYVMNPLPDIEIFKSEIDAMRTTVIDGDLTKIK